MPDATISATAPSTNPASLTCTGGVSFVQTAIPETPEITILVACRLIVAQAAARGYRFRPRFADRGSRGRDVRRRSREPRLTGAGSPRASCERSGPVAAEHYRGRYAAPLVPGPRATALCRVSDGVAAGHAPVSVRPLPLCHAARGDARCGRCVRRWSSKETERKQDRFGVSAIRLCKAAVLKGRLCRKAVGVCGQTCAGYFIGSILAFSSRSSLGLQLR